MVKIEPRTWEPAPVTPISTRLGGGGFDYTSAPLSLRIGAGLVDAGVVLIFAGLPCWFWEFQSANAVRGGVPAVLLFGAGLLLLTAGFGFKGQTVGQRFFGLMVATAPGREVWPARGFALALLTILTGWSLPLMLLLLPGHRSLADWLCGVRTIHDRVLGFS